MAPWSRRGEVVVPASMVTEAVKISMQMGISPQDALHLLLTAHIATPSNPRRFDPVIGLAVVCLVCVAVGIVIGALVW